MYLVTLLPLHPPFVLIIRAVVIVAPILWLLSLIVDFGPRVRIGAGPGARHLDEVATAAGPLGHEQKVPRPPA